MLLQAAEALVGQGMDGTRIMKDLKLIAPSFPISFVADVFYELRTYDRVGIGIEAKAHPNILVVGSAVTRHYANPVKFGKGSGIGE